VGSQVFTYLQALRVKFNGSRRLAETVVGTAQMDSKNHRLIQLFVACFSIYLLLGFPCFSLDLRQ
jgi:hypothetical protein